MSIVNQQTTVYSGNSLCDAMHEDSRIGNDISLLIELNSWCNNLKYCYKCEYLGFNHT